MSSNTEEFSNIINGQFEDPQERYGNALNDSKVLGLCQAVEDAGGKLDTPAYAELLNYLEVNYRLGDLDARDIYRQLVELERGEIE